MPQNDTTQVIKLTLSHKRKSLSNTKKDLIISSAKKLFIEKSIKDVSMQDIAENAGVGKGTLYLYFQNKNELILEAFSLISKEQTIEAKNKIVHLANAKEKILALFSFYTDESGQDVTRLYIDFYTVCMTNYNQTHKEFNTLDYEELFEFIEDILNQDIESGKIKYKDVTKLSKSICAAMDGLFFYSVLMDGFDLKDEMQNYLDTLFAAIEA